MQRPSSKTYLKSSHNNTKTTTTQNTLKNRDQSFQNRERNPKLKTPESKRSEIASMDLRQEEKEYQKTSLHGYRG